MRKCAKDLPYVLGVLFFNNVIIATRKHPILEVKMMVKVGVKRKIAQFYQCLALSVYQQMEVGDFIKGVLLYLCCPPVRNFK